MIVWHLACILSVLLLTGGASAAHKQGPCVFQDPVRHTSVWKCPGFYAGLILLSLLWFVGIAWDWWWSKPAS
jgi:hypothetical protein